MFTLVPSAKYYDDIDDVHTEVPPLLISSGTGENKPLLMNQVTVAHCLDGHIIKQIVQVRHSCMSLDCFDPGVFEGNCSDLFDSIF